MNPRRFIQFFRSPTGVVVAFLLITGVVITLAIGAVCWGTYIAFKSFVSQFDEATKMLNDLKI